jgi:RNA polymerase sigma-70 factor, ECF subfamily
MPDMCGDIEVHSTSVPPAAGDAERRTRFDALYAAYSARVLGYLLRRTANSDDAADAMAETFTIAWRRIGTVPAGDDARLWLYGVARRVLANQRRAERRRSSLADRLRTELSAAPRSAGAGEELADVLAAFRGLGERDREVLMLEGWEGLGPPEIAAVLGCSRNAARIRLHRARRRLADALARPNQPAADAAPPVVRRAV